MLGLLEVFVLLAKFAELDTRIHFDFLFCCLEFFDMLILNPEGGLLNLCFRELIELTRLFVATDLVDLNSVEYLYELFMLIVQS